MMLCFCRFNICIPNCPPTNANAITDVSHRRRIRTLELALAVLAMNVPGDFVETGTHVGGTATLLMKVLMSFDDRERLFWGADSFQGLPEGGAGDMVDRNIFSFSNTKFRTPGAIAIRRGQFRAGKQQVRVGLLLCLDRVSIMPKTLHHQSLSWTD